MIVIKNIFLLSNKNYNMNSLFTMLRQVIGAKKQLLCFLAFFIGFGLLLASGAVAQDLYMQDLAEQSNLPTVSLATFIGRLFQIFFGLLGVVALALLMYGGFIWMTAIGDSGKIDKAKKIIQNAIIGLIIIFSAFAITTFLMGIFGKYNRGGGSGGGGDFFGGTNDWSRSGIGAGPIESVYPKPNQVGVPINTRIAVTFKQAIKPDSICETVNADGKCFESLAKNIRICETSTTSSNCLNDSLFNVSSTVTQTDDGRTFVFIPKGFLGAEDEKIRIFRVTIDGGVKVSSTGESIFKGQRTNYYAWQFKTNGKLDLDPPEIAKFEIYPYPDDESDIYHIGSNATAGSQTITIDNNKLQTENLPQLDGENITNNFEKQLTNSEGTPGAMRVVIKSTTGFDVINSNTIKFTIGSDGTYAIFSSSTVSAVKISFSKTGACSGKGDYCLPISDNKFIETGAGFSIEASSNFIPGLSWSFSVSTSSDGHELSLMDKDSVVANFIFVSPIDTRTTISKRVTSDDGHNQIIKNYIAVKKGVNVVNTTQNLIESLNLKTNGKVEATTTTSENIIKVTARNAGFNDLKMTSFFDSLVIGGDSLSGEAKVIGWTIKPDRSKLKDPFNNSIFRITFNEAINPINVSNYIRVYALTTNELLVASTTVTNQYRTIELKGITPCGTNACGDHIFCWVNPSTSSPESVPIKIVVEAASLMTCSTDNNEWCRVFGGTCSTGSRCKNGLLFYPQASNQLDGIIDMSNNSLNGNFNKVTNAKGILVGNAEGKSGSGSGYSGFSPYNLNNTINKDNDHRPTYASIDEVGDSFQWSFFLSNQVDNQSPLIREIHPVGDEIYGWKQNQSFAEPVEIIFDRLMSFSSLRPGWGYSDIKDDEAWFRRFLVLKTITEKVNPVGYWISSFDVDKDRDGLADFTKTLINHNPFDQSVTYGPLVGSGVISITQNCFLPAGAPQRAADPNNQNEGIVINNCNYDDSGLTTKNCTTDDTSAKVKLPQPASYGYMNCNNIEGYNICRNDESCMVPYYNKNDKETHKFGSWIITKDKNVVDSNGRTGCCFGKCVKLSD